MRSRVIFFLLISSVIPSMSKDIELYSPSKNILIKIDAGDTVRYSVYFKGKIILLPSIISLEMPGKVLGINSHFKNYSIRSYNDIIIPVIPQRRNRIRDICNELTIVFKEGYSIIFRTYDDAIAWRFTTGFKSDIKIINEIAEFKFADNNKIFIPLVNCRKEVDCYQTSFEENYTATLVSDLDKSKIGFLPVEINLAGSSKMIITESDLLDYPGMWLRKGNDNFSLKADFARFPLEKKIFGEGYKQILVTQRTDYLAITQGTRNFPWRIIAFANEDKDLLDNDIVYKLAAKNKITDTSWIKPGTCTDEWIVSRNFFNVDFKTGFNTDTYKYIIDFASATGLEYVMFDAGWSDQADLLKVTPGLDLPWLINYAKQKNTGVILWCLAMSVDQQMDLAFSQFESWGIKGVLVDFMDRDDQETVNFYERAARTAANHKLLISFHGAYKDTGLSRTYPNNITREGVLGHEYNMWSEKVTPEHDILIGFIRNFAGPMDYEGGCMNNAQKNDFRVVYNNPMSQGTRIHQLAQYIVYISPLQVIAGNFSQYLKEPEYSEFIGNIPSSWDKSLPIDGKIGEYILIARKFQDEWYVAGLSGWEAQDLEFSLSFLDNAKYTAEIFQDGINSSTYAADYKILKTPVNNGDSIKIHMANGGGWVARFYRDK
jgi:alpha-glucosidase